MLIFSLFKRNVVRRLFFSLVERSFLFQYDYFSIIHKEYSLLPSNVYSKWKKNNGNNNERAKLIKSNV